MENKRKTSNPAPPSGGLKGAEVWKVIPDFPRYEVSNLGRVRSSCCNAGRKKKFIIKPSLRTNGYFYVTLFDTNAETGKVKVKQVGVHRLVARAFIGEYPPGCVIDHINGEAWDNRLENLHYASLSENQANKHNDRYKDGFRIEIFRDGVFFAEVTTRKALLDTVGKNYKYRKSNSGSSLNALFNTGRTWRYKNFYAVLVLPHDEVELGPAPHVQFKFEV